mmetsp:Transcript_1657/g.2930  ORF Transcript_1657/g.2930 Transcript_1657/m.2930 type:complete len:148 (-) Transcript_1657:763-1206(-)
MKAEDVRPLYPFINFTKMLSEEFANSVPYCYEFLFVEFASYWAELYATMNNDFTTMLISFLFSQMGNAKDYKSALDKIAENELNQQYELVMFQYGRIVRLLIFEITLVEQGPQGEDISELRALVQGVLDSIAELPTVKILKQAMLNQ